MSNKVLCFWPNSLMSFARIYESYNLIYYFINRLKSNPRFLTLIKYHPNSRHHPFWPGWLQQFPHWSPCLHPFAVCFQHKTQNNSVKSLTMSLLCVKLFSDSYLIQNEILSFYNEKKAQHYPCWLYLFLLSPLSYQHCCLSRQAHSTVPQLFTRSAPSPPASSNSFPEESLSCPSCIKFPQLYLSFNISCFPSLFLF